MLTLETPTIKSITRAERKGKIARQIAIDAIKANLEAAKGSYQLIRVGKSAKSIRGVKVN